MTIFTIILRLYLFISFGVHLFSCQQTSLTLTSMSLTAEEFIKLSKIQRSEHLKKNVTIYYKIFLCLYILGVNCSSSTSSEGLQGAAGSGVIYGVIITLGLALGIIFVIIYYRSRIKKLKSELDVHYSTGPGQQQSGKKRVTFKTTFIFPNGIQYLGNSERIRFDNPVYNSSAHEPLNNSRIANNLTAKNTNSQRDKINYLSADDQSDSASKKGIDNSISKFI